MCRDDWGLRKPHYGVLVFQVLRTRMGMEKDPRPVSPSFEWALWAAGRTQGWGENSRIPRNHVCLGFGCSVFCGLWPPALVSLVFTSV